MRTYRISSRLSRSLGALALLALGATTVTAQEAAHHDMPMPETGLQAELIRDITRLEGQYTSLAEAMTGKYDWRPGEGVRSVGEVYMHIAGANFMLPTFVGIAPPASMKAANMEEAMAAMQALEKETDPAKMHETLKHSFTHAKHAVAQVTDAQLEEKTKFFGQDVTKRFVITMLVSHMHEHLGQSIAYARTNGVTPPWRAAE